MPEPLADALRRLHERSKRGDRASRDPGSPYGCVNETLAAAVYDGEQARREAANALPALADIVAWCEQERSAHTRDMRFECSCKMCQPLAALREQLGTR